MRLSCSAGAMRLVALLAKAWRLLTTFAYDCALATAARANREVCKTEKRITKAA